VDRLCVFRDLQIGHLPKKQEVAFDEPLRVRFREARLLKLEETTSYVFDYSSETRLLLYSITLKTRELRSSFAQRTCRRVRFSTES
jgi:hypothetical protein